MVQVGGGREGQALAQELQFQITGVAQMFTTGTAADVCQRVFQQGQQRGGGQALAHEEVGDMAQEAAGCGEGQRAAGAVVGRNAPAVQGRL